MKTNVKLGAGIYILGSVALAAITSKLTPKIIDHLANRLEKPTSSSFDTQDWDPVIVKRTKDDSTHTEKGDFHDIL